MEPKGIIISNAEYNRLKEINNNYDGKVKECRENFKKGLEKAIRGDLVKILWVNDQYYANLKGCDLSDDGICSFVSREDADLVDSISSNESYDREKLIQRATQKVPKELPTTKKDFDTYQEIIERHERTIRNLWWAFGIMFVAWLVQIILYIAK